MKEPNTSRNKFVMVAISNSWYQSLKFFFIPSCHVFSLVKAFIWILGRIYVICYKTRWDFSPFNAETTFYPSRIFDFKLQVHEIDNQAYDHVHLIPTNTM